MLKRLASVSAAVWLYLAAPAQADPAGNFALLPLISAQVTTSQSGDGLAQIGFQAGSPPAPIDLTGISFDLQWHPSNGGVLNPAIVSLSAGQYLTNGGPTGVLSLTIPRSRLRILPTGTYAASLVATLNGATVDLGVVTITHTAIGSSNVTALSTTQRNAATATSIGYVPGPQGPSAYQVAVANGFVGTQAQWLATLVGPTGPAGNSYAIGTGPGTIAAGNDYRIVGATQNAAAAITGGSINGTTGDLSGNWATTGGVSEVLSSLLSRSAIYPTRAAAALLPIPSTTTSVQLGGFAAQGDGGAARYVAVASQPAHQGKFQSADGRWWAIAEKVLRPEQFGGAADDTTDNLAPINAAMGVFSYQNTGGISGGQIQLGRGSYAVSGSIDTNGKHGLRLIGDGFNNTQVRGTGNFPVFKDIGTSTTGTAEVEIGSMKIRCAGKDNANAHGVQWDYPYNGKLHDLFVYSCNHGLDISDAWQLNMFRVRGDGTGALQSNIGLYLGVADPTNAVINNAVNATDVIMNNNAQYNFRLINFQGSKFNGVEGGAAGLSNWYLCDPPTGNAPCQWGHFDNVLADTAPQYGFLIRQGNASEMNQFFFGNMWIGNIYDAGTGIGMRIDGGQDIPISSLLAVKTVTAISLNNSARINVHGTITNYNIANQSKPAIALTGSIDNVFNVTTYTTQPVVGYKGYVEDANSYRNRLYGLGPASCSLGLTFGGSSSGLTYSANGCTYEVEGTAVRAQFLMTLSAKGTSTGNAALTGLPFPASGGAPGFGTISPFMAVNGFSGLTSVPFAQMQTGGTQAFLMQQGATGTGNLADTNFSNTATFTGALNYFKQ